jgi:formylglycine-generating enzyme required for sulfatase activity
VPALRDWLTREQNWAELLLADRAAVWNARPENSQLPSLLQWLQIRWYTTKKQWTPPQRKMMGKAGRYHAVRGAIVAALLAVATVTGLVVRKQVVEERNATHAAGLVQSLLKADTAQVKSLVSQMENYRKWTDPLLREEYDKAAVNSRPQLHASLALLPVDASQADYLYGRLLDADPHEVPVIRDGLAPHKEQLVDKLWAVVQTPEKGKEAQRLRAAAALARYNPEGKRWAKVQKAVANDLVRVPAVHLAAWLESFRPVRAKLLAPLAVVFRDAKRRETERSLGTDILADYAADQPQLLLDLLMDADEKQFAVLYAKFKEQFKQGLSVLTGEIDKKLPPDLPSSDDKREKLAKRQANAAVALLRMNQPAKVWPLLKHSPDPRVRSYLIHRFGPLGADPAALIKCLDEEADATIRRALLLSLGQYTENEFSRQARQAFLPKLRQIYQTHADAGIHAAAEWLLRKWEEQAWLKKVNEEWKEDKAHRPKRLADIQQRQWYVNSQGQTMVVIPGPEEFLMGSPPTEVRRSPIESQHKQRIGRTFALAATPVTVKDFELFLRADPTRKQRFQAGEPAAHLLINRYSPEADCPIILIDWYTAAAYCNWLSKEEDIDQGQWCYETDGAGQVVKLKENYLRLEGYRLPTEAEWEYACRAGAVTSRCYGETEELLPWYGWYQKNSEARTWPVGSKKPNDLGVFDLHGNVYTWCQERYKGDYPALKDGESIEDKEDALNIKSTDRRLLRGGSFYDPASNLRCADRDKLPPTTRDDYVGFRLARTFAP